MLLFAAGAFLAACRSAPRTRDDPMPRFEPTVLDEEAVPVPSADFLPAFHALRAAVREGDDATAASILTGIQARGPQGDDLELAQDFARLLRGRAAVRDLDLRLESEPGAEPGHYRLFLVLAHHGEGTRSLRLPPGKLRRRRSAIDPDGFEQVELETSFVQELTDAEIPAGGERRVQVQEFTVPMGRALAQRERWSLDVLSGEIVVEGEVCPASGVRVAALETTYLAPFLPPRAVEPEVLASYLERDEIFLPPLLERAVRIPPARREEALAAVLAVLEGQANVDRERMAIIAPALCWLAETTDPGVDPRAWIRYLHGRLARPPAAQGPPARPALDLPEDVSAAPAEDPRPEGTNER